MVLPEIAEILVLLDVLAFENRLVLLGACELAFEFDDQFLILSVSSTGNCHQERKSQ